MELIKSVKKRGIVSRTLHVLFNALFVAALLGLILGFPDTPWAALALVLVSKWRIFAVRPRFWFANLLSNMTDLLLGLGIVLLMWECDGALAIQCVLAALYAVWLIFVKPMHKRLWVLIQAFTSQFVALAALFSVAHLIPLVFVVVLSFAIGFSAARHVLSIHKENSRTLLSMVWGLIVAELGFVAYHWTIAYTIFAPLKIAQIAIVVTVLGFVADQCYESRRLHDKVRWQDVRWPVLFAVVLIGMLLFWFSGLNSASQL